MSRELWSFKLAGPWLAGQTELLVSKRITVIQGIPTIHDFTICVPSYFVILFQRKLAKKMDFNTGSLSMAFSL